MIISISISMIISISISLYISAVFSRLKLDQILSILIILLDQNFVSVHNDLVILILKLTIDYAISLFYIFRYLLIYN